MVITIVIVMRTVSERQISMFLIVLAIVLPPQFLCFNISMPLRFLCELKNLLRLVLTLQVLWQCSGEMLVLYYSLHSWRKFSLCEISYEIERRFYQEVLSPDLKWRKQA